jgi:hypothetical protein
VTSRVAAAERAEGALQPVEPRRLAGVREDAHVQPARVAQRRDEEVQPLAHAGDVHRALAEVDLELIARGRLEAHGRPRLGPQCLPQRRDRALDGAERHGDPVVAREVLAHDVGIATVLRESGGEPRLEAVQPSDAQGPRRWRPRAVREVPLDGVLGAPDFPGDPLRAPAEGMETQNHGNFIGRTQGLPLRSWQTREG